MQRQVQEKDFPSNQLTFQDYDIFEHFKIFRRRLAFCYSTIYQ